MKNIELLNETFAIDGVLSIVEGDGGFPVIEIGNDEANASISVYAGQVLSYLPVKETQDVIFLSESALYEQNKAIRGGIPVCWPWFGPDPKNTTGPAHGFVRNRSWNIIKTKALSEDSTQVQLEITDDCETQEFWPYAFQLVLIVTVGSTLTIELVTKNMGDKDFTISQALHTYFNIGDISQVKVSGLEGVSYFDKVSGKDSCKQDEPVIVNQEVDRVYNQLSNSIIMYDEDYARTITISSRGSDTAVIWNPWIEKSQTMLDMEDDEYNQMICVETANAGTDIIRVSAGGSHSLTAEYLVQSF